MLIKRLFFICTLPSVIAGCAELYGTQSPAPVYENRPAVYRKEPVYPAEPEPAKPAQNSTEHIEIKPLREPEISAPVAIEAEPLSPEQAQSLLTPEQEQELATLEQAQNAAEPTPEAAPTAPQPALTEPAEEKLPQPAPPPAPVFEPLKSFGTLSPAVGALVVAANQNAEKGDIQSATTTIERAIRIEPRNATLYYKLALLRLNESKPRLAEDLAKKSALLASNDTRLKKHSWLLIAKAREMQKNFDGAKEAKAKADGF
ncbi:MAG: hypothetical protein Q7U57_13420 [Methylovulum sp.]|nr:hypothetical protein [Methylovulum sp.]